MRYKGVILDFNGTLIWDTLLHKKAWLDFCRELGYVITEKQYYNEIHGKSTRDILKNIMGHDLDAGELDRLSARKEGIYRQACLDNPDIYRFAPGVEDFLGFLAENDIPRTIATASEKINLDFFVETLELDRWFEPELFIYDDGSLAIKPEPDVYLKAAEKLGLPAEDLLVVEDTFFGALAAKAAGIGCLIITGPEADRHGELFQIDGVYRFISDFSEIDRNLFFFNER